MNSLLDRTVKEELEGRIFFVPPSERTNERTNGGTNFKSQSRRRRKFYKALLPSLLP